MARKQPKLKFEIDGLDSLMKSLAQFQSKTTAKRIMRGAMNKAAQVLLKEARKNAPVDSKTLKKALTKKIGFRDVAMFAVIGADASKEGTGPDGRKRIPNKYVHLAEYGFQHALTGEHVPGSRFLERTTQQHVPDVARKFTEEVTVRIEKELAKRRGQKGKK